MLGTAKPILNDTPANPQARRGYSRDHRSDCKQVCIGLVVTTLRKRCITRPEEHQAILLHRLGLHPPKRMKNMASGHRL